MKKRNVLILVIGIAAVGLLAAGAILFRSTPVLEEGKHYTIVHAEDWPDGYQSRKEVNLQGKEAEILSCLSGQRQRRMMTSLPRGSGDPVQIPDWPRFVLTIACDEGDPFLVLVGEDQSQRCTPGYRAPVYQILEEDALYTAMKNLTDGSGREATNAADTPAAEASYQLPVVHNVSETSIANAVLPLLQTMYGADIDVCSITVQQPELETENKTLAFTVTDGTLYLADIDPESKQVVAIETAAPKSAVPSDAARQTEYVSAAKAFAETLFQATGLEESSCYQPVQPISGQVTSDSVYVVFPEIQTYVEVSADDGHALVGYRHFADDQALGQFLDRQGKAF